MGRMWGWKGLPHLPCSPSIHALAFSKLSARSLHAVCAISMSELTTCSKLPHRLHNHQDSAYVAKTGCVHDTSCCTW